MSAAVTFLIALVLLVAFVFFRFWEQKRGVKVWADARNTADEVVSDMYTSAVLGSFPHKYRIAFLNFLHTLLHDSVVFAVESLRALERPLTRLSYRLRQSAPSANGKEPSAFLKNLVSEKKPEESSGTTDTV